MILLLVCMTALRGIGIFLESNMVRNDTAYSFEQALTWIKQGRKATRTGWNGKGMFLYLVRQDICIVDSSNEETKSLIGLYAEGTEIEYSDRIDMRYANGKHGVWTPTHEDLLSNDWILFV
jgi:hypothetical protein